MTAQKKAGSPNGEPLYLVVGYLRRPHGVRGEIIMDIHTDFPERNKKGRKIFIGDKYESAEFESVRAHAGGLLVKLIGVDTPEEVGRFRNQWVYIAAKDAPPLPQGKHYKFEYIGVDVVDENGNALGKIQEIIETGANDVYVVKDEEEKEILLPAIPSVVIEVDMTARKMKVHVLEGL